MGRYIDWGLRFHRFATRTWRKLPPLVKFSFLIAVLYVWAYRDVLRVGMFRFADTIAFPLKADDAWNALGRAWQPDNFGIPGFASDYYAIIAILITILRDPSVAQKVFYLSPLPLGSIGMYLFLRRSISWEVARFSGAILYSINPLVAYGGPPGPLSFLHAVYPLTALMLQKIFSERLSLSLFALSVLVLGTTMLVSSYIALLLLPLAAAFGGVEFLLSDQRWQVLRRGAALVPILILALVLDLPTAAGLLPTQVGSALANQNISVLISGVETTYRAASMSQLLRLSGIAEGAENFLGYLDFSGWAIAGYVLPILCMVSLLGIKRSFLSKTVLALAVLWIGVFAQIWLTHLGWLTSVYQRFPILFIFHNPKLYGLAPLVYAGLNAATFEGLKEHTLPGIGFGFTFGHFQGIKLTLRRSLCIVLPVLIAVAISIYNWPLFTGDMGISFALKNYNTDLAIRPDYYRVGKWLDKQRETWGSFRTFWLPRDGDVAGAIRWIDPHPAGLLVGEFRLNALPLRDYVFGTFDLLCDTENHSLGELLGRTNVKYVILDLGNPRYLNDASPCHRVPEGIGGNPRGLFGLLEKEKGLAPVADIGDFIIFENAGYVPHLAVYGQVLQIEEKPSPALVVSSGANWQENLVVFKGQLAPDLASALAANVESTPMSNSRQIGSRVISESDTAYSIVLEGQGPAFISLGENYDPGWSANLNGESLPHFIAMGWANGYYVSDILGKANVEIVFEPQERRDIILWLWGACWVGFLGALGLVWVRNHL
jgi:hypothetical protein